MGKSAYEIREHCKHTCAHDGEGGSNFFILVRTS